MSRRLSVFNGMTDLSNDLTDFGETAALIENLDLVITVDTAMGHLAGAMGKPVWICCPKAADWRWMLERERQPLVPDRAAVPAEDRRRLGSGDSGSHRGSGGVASRQHRRHCRQLSAP